MGYIRDICFLSMTRNGIINSNLVGYLFNERTDINRSVLTIRRISCVHGGEIHRDYTV